MKLLSALDVQTEKHTREQNEALRIAMMNEQVTEKTKALHTVKLEFSLKKEELEKDWNGYQQEIGSKKELLRKEVVSLESRKVEALKPLTRQINESRKLLVLQNEKEQLLKHSEEELEKTRQRLIRLSNKIEAREESAKELELRAFVQLNKVSDREISLEKNEQLFNAKLRFHQAEYLEKSNKLAQEESVLKVGLEWIEKRETSVQEKEKELALKQERLTAQESRLRGTHQKLKAKGLI